MNNVEASNLSIVDEPVRLPAGDLDLVHAALDDLREMQLALGAELDHHLGVVATLRTQIERKQSAYVALIDILVKKHVKRPGKFAFRPEVGAFVREREEEP